MSAIALAAVTLSIVLAAEDTYVDVPLNQVPRPVAQAVMKKYPDAQPQSASKGVEENKSFYDIFIKVKGQKIWVTCDPQGAILAVDREITTKELPKPVVEALVKKYPNATVRMVNEITEASSAVYEIAITVNKKPLIAIYSATGGFLEELEDDEPAASAASAASAK